MNTQQNSDRDSVESTALLAKLEADLLHSENAIKTCIAAQDTFEAGCWRAERNRIQELIATKRSQFANAQGEAQPPAKNL